MSQFIQPWLDIDMKYPVGTKVRGKVVNFMPYGAFIELEKGVEGLVHISELSWSKRYNHPNELLAIGDVVDIEEVLDYLNDLGNNSQSEPKLNGGTLSEP